MHSVFVALSSEVDAETDEGQNEEAEDDAAHDEKDHVFLDKSSNNIFTIINCGHWIGSISPLAEVILSMIMALVGFIILQLKNVDFFIT